MATQGLISITRDGEVVAKIVMGANGYDVPAMAADLRDHPVENYRTGLRVGLLRFCEKWCVDNSSVVIQFSPDEMVMDGKFVNAEDYPLYKEKFADPIFNPRWDRGTASYMEIVELPANTRAERIVSAIIRDLTDRGSLGSAWDSIDGDIRLEIRNEWKNIVNDNISGTEKYGG